jgi:hypothetical protein
VVRLKFRQLTLGIRAVYPRIQVFSDSKGDVIETGTGMDTVKKKIDERRYTECI